MLKKLFKLLNWTPLHDIGEVGGITGFAQAPRQKFKPVSAHMDFRPAKPVRFESGVDPVENDWSSYKPDTIENFDKPGGWRSLFSGGKGRSNDGIGGI